MKKKVLSTLLVGAMAASLFAGCTGGSTTKPATNLGGTNERPTLSEYGSGEILIWAPESVVDVTEEKAKKFISEHPEYSGYTIKVEATGEDVAAKNVLTDMSAAADIFGFAQDQLSRLVAAGVLAPFAGYYQDSITKSNDEYSVAASKVGDTVYAFPYTSDNGYYVYYDKSVITDPTSLEKMIEDCEAAEKNFYIDLGNGWYQPAFFFATKCQLTYDTNVEGKFTQCNIDYNSEKGLVALKEIVEVSSSPYFVGGSDAGKAVNVGFIIVGPWADNQMKQMLGDNYAAAKLPTFVGSDGETYQLSGFSGFKLMGVKKQSDQAKQLVCLHLTEYLTGEECQLARFEKATFGPSNLAAQANPDVQANEALKALNAQFAHTIPQGQYPDAYWNRAGALFNDVKDAGLSDAELMEKLEAFENDCKGFCNVE